MLMPIRTGHNEVANQNSVMSTTLQWGTAATQSTINTYGSWNAVFTTPPKFTVTLLKVTITGAVASATNKNCYVDIGIGTTTGDAVVLVEKLSGAGAASALVGLGRTYLIPVRVPFGASQQFYVRTQCVAITGLPAVQIVAYGGHDVDPPLLAGSGVVALGAVTATSTGTTVTPGSTGAEGAWTQIIAATAEDYIGFLISTFCDDTTMSASAYCWDIGIGAAAAEVSIGENITHQIHDSGEAISSVSHAVMVRVPAGTRLSVRCSCGVATDGPNISAIINAIRP